MLGLKSIHFSKKGPLDVISDHVNIFSWINNRLLCLVIGALTLYDRNCFFDWYPRQRHMQHSAKMSKQVQFIDALHQIKSPAKFLLNEQYVFVGGNIYFLCVLSCSSEEA